MLRTTFSQRLETLRPHVPEAVAQLSAAMMCAAGGLKGISDALMPDMRLVYPTHSVYGPDFRRDFTWAYM